MFAPKGLNIGHIKENFNYIRNHFRYYTLNSWNRLKSIANNVKVYNLDLTTNIDLVFDCLDKDPNIWDILNTAIDDFEMNHPGYCVGFNGRSDGYLVLYNKENNSSVIPAMIEDYETYSDFKEEMHYMGYTMKELTQTVREYTLLVRDFDYLCDYMTLLLDYNASRYSEAKKELN